MSIQTFQAQLSAKQILDTSSVLLSLKTDSKIQYIPGQFITLHVLIQGTIVKRSYSLCSHPEIDSDLKIAVKAIPGGLVSNHLVSEITVGTELTFDAPMGSFIPVTTNRNENTHYIFFAAGSGITPIFSLVQEILQFRQNCSVSLFYSARTRENLWFKSQLDDMEQKYKHRFQLHYVLSKPDKNWVGLTGRIHQALAVYLIKQVAAASYLRAQYYLCGPEGMMQEVEKAFQLLSVSEKQVHKEKFSTTPINDGGGTASSDVSIVTIIDGSKKFTIEVKNNEYILQKALENNIPLPYSCQSGMCTACMGKCKEGQVQMIDQEGLTENEIKKGYILTCVSRPVSDKVTIEF